MNHLLFLHGAIGASRQLLTLTALFAESYNTHALEFSGHGSTPLAADGFSIPLFANDVLEYMDENGIDKTSVFGYSMGGYVGMYLLRHFPERIDKVITLATKFHWDEATATKEVQMLNADKIQEKLPAFAATLNERHNAIGWHNVLKQTAEMMIALGKNNVLSAEDYSTISTPVLILLGDRDKMVSLQETIDVFKAIPTAQYGILPNTPHPIEQVDIELLSFLIKRFLAR